MAYTTFLHRLDQLPQLSLLWGKEERKNQLKTVQQGAYSPLRKEKKKEFLPSYLPLVINQKDH